MVPCKTKELLLNYNILVMLHMYISKKFIGKLHIYVWGPIGPCVQTALEEARPNIQPHIYKRRKKWPSPMSSLRVGKYPRTTNKRRDKITLRGEVERACEEFGRVRGRWSPRNFYPRYLVNLLVTQSNAWGKPYNKVKGEISNKG